MSIRTEELLLSVIVQLIVIILAARIAGALFRRMGQPQVCGEIAAGLILGPSLFGGIFPGAFAVVFPPHVGEIFGVLSQLGLILLLFLIGLEFDFSHLRANGRTPLLVSAAGIIVPFTLGILVAGVLHPVVGAGIDRLAFTLFIGIAMCITALPILGRIMIELRLHRTRLGVVTITSAAIDDAVGWIMLAVVTAVVRSNVDPVATLLMVGQTLAFGAVMMLAVRPLMHRWATRTLARNGGELSLGAFGVVLAVVFGAAAVTNVIGIFSIFGAFLAGAILFDHVGLREALRTRLHDFVTVFFLPIFFTYTGLRTDIGSVQGTTLWVLCGMVLVAAMAGKFGGCTLAARASGMPWRESFALGTMMNTRALMELIVINVGYDLGIIPDSVFFMLVFMAVVTTFMTAPILRRILPVEVPIPAPRPPLRMPEPAGVGS